MNSSRLNGWERLGIVVSTLIAIPSVLIAYDSNDSSYVSYFGVSSAVQKLDGQEFIDEAYAEAYRQHTDRLKDCVQSSIQVTASGILTTNSNIDITCDNDTASAVVESLPYGALPFWIIFGIGYIVAWVRRGFRNPSN